MYSSSSSLNISSSSSSIANSMPGVLCRSCLGPTRKEGHCATELRKTYSSSSVMMQTGTLTDSNEVLRPWRGFPTIFENRLPDHDRPTHLSVTYSSSLHWPLHYQQAGAPRVASNLVRHCCFPARMLIIAAGQPAYLGTYNALKRPDRGSEASPSPLAVRFPI